ncbi:MAG: hypothetical protein P4L51_29740 [Puia sp.]|nr:hypothetical protein [Puia sp.]
MTDTRSIYKILSKALLLSVYLVFFFVQLFFNFEAFQNAQFFSKCPSLTSYFGGHQRVSSKGPLHAARKPTIRLNKRFQQENNPPIELISSEFPSRYASSVNTIPFGQYRNGLHPHLFYTSTPLRGPPFAG